MLLHHVRPPWGVPSSDAPLLATGESLSPQLSGLGGPVGPIADGYHVELAKQDEDMRCDVRLPALQQALLQRLPRPPRGVPSPLGPSPATGEGMLRLPSGPEDPAVPVLAADTSRPAAASAILTPVVSGLQGHLHINTHQAISANKHGAHVDIHRKISASSAQHVGGQVWCLVWGLIPARP